MGILARAFNKSKTEIRRLIKAGGMYVWLEGWVRIKIGDLIEIPAIIRLGKKEFRKII